MFRKLETKEGLSEAFNGLTAEQKLQLAEMMKYSQNFASPYTEINKLGLFGSQGLYSHSNTNSTSSTPNNSLRKLSK
jgi:hypothetical protein